MQPENRPYLLVTGTHLTCPHDLRQGPLGTRVLREPNKELTVHPLYNITLLFPTQTCQFQMGLLQRAQQNVLGLQIQMRDVSFMQELQGTSWGASPRKISQSLVPTCPRLPFTLFRAHYCGFVLAGLQDTRKHQTPATFKGMHCHH